MNITQIQENIKRLASSFSKETFIYDLLLAYGLPKTAIKRLQKGTRNLSKNEDEITCEENGVRYRKWRVKLVLYVYFQSLTLVTYNFNIHLDVF